MTWRHCWQGIDSQVTGSSTPDWALLHSGLVCFVTEQYHLVPTTGVVSMSGKLTEVPGGK